MELFATIGVATTHGQMRPVSFASGLTRFIEWVCIYLLSLPLRTILIHQPKSVQGPSLVSLGLMYGEGAWCLMCMSGLVRVLLCGPRQ